MSLRCSTELQLTRSGVVRGHESIGDPLCHSLAEQRERECGCVQREKEAVRSRRPTGFKRWKRETERQHCENWNRECYQYKRSDDNDPKRQTRRKSNVEKEKTRSGETKELSPLKIIEIGRRVPKGGRSICQGLSKDILLKHNSSESWKIHFSLNFFCQICQALY